MRQVSISRMINKHVMAEVRIRVEVAGVVIHGCICLVVKEL